MSYTSDSSKKSGAGHRERLRSRLEFEPVAMADYEILELFLGLSIKRKDTKLLAKELLARFGSLRGCLDATPGELTQISGFGPGLCSLWQLFHEVMARYAAGPLINRTILASPHAVAEMALARLSHLPHEESWVALLNTQNRMLSWEKLGRGGIDFIALQPRDVMEVALLRKASAIILVHNHPGGNPVPSRADIMLTNEIKEISLRLGIRFLDHVIVSTGGCYSFEQDQILRNV